MDLLVDAGYLEDDSAANVPDLHLLLARSEKPEAGAIVLIRIERRGRTSVEKSVTWSNDSGKGLNWFRSLRRWILFRP